MNAGVVIVGGGHGGSQTAASLRSEGYEGRVTLICDEPDIPYQRPPLSKTYLKEPEKGLQELRPEKFYSDHAIDLRLNTRAFAAKAREKAVFLLDGTSIPFEHLVLATGASPRMPPVLGTDLAGVFALRDARDARRINAAFAETETVVVIGGGFIGLELAATARSLGRTVTVLEAADRLMGRAVCQEISNHFLDLHRAWGTTVLLSTPANGIIGRDGVAVGVDAGGRVIPADLVIIGAGVIPNTDLAVQLGLPVANGIVVDEALQAAPGIYAIGDCASFPEPHIGRRMRLESVQNAVDHGKAVAKHIVGKGERYHAVPWFWSDQADVKLQMVGLGIGCDRRVIRGRPADGQFSVFQFAGDRLIAIDSVNRGADHMLGRRVLDKAGTPPTPEQAGDESFDLKSLVRRAASG